MCIRSKQRLTPPQSVTETRRCQSDKVTLVSPNKNSLRSATDSDQGFVSLVHFSSIEYLKNTVTIIIIIIIIHLKTSKKNP